MDKDSHKLTLLPPLKSSLSVLIEPRFVVLQFASFVAIIFVLQWLLQISTFSEVVTNSSLSISDKLDTFSTAFFDVFRLIDDLTPISFVLIALFQSSSLVMLASLRSSRKKRRQQFASLGIALIGSGCVACGGSILSPVLGIVAAELSVGLAESIGNFVLIGAIIVSSITWYKIGNMFYKEMGLT